MHDKVRISHETAPCCLAYKVRDPPRGALCTAMRVRWQYDSAWSAGHLTLHFAQSSQPIHNREGRAARCSIEHRACYLPAASGAPASPCFKLFSSLFVAPTLIISSHMLTAVYHSFGLSFHWASTFRRDPFLMGKRVVSSHRLDSLVPQDHSPHSRPYHHSPFAVEAVFPLHSKKIFTQSAQSGAIPVAYWREPFRYNVLLPLSPMIRPLAWQRGETKEAAVAARLPRPMFSRQPN